MTMKKPQALDSGITDELRDVEKSLSFQDTVKLFTKADAERNWEEHDDEISMEFQITPKLFCELTLVGDRNVVSAKVACGAEGEDLDRWSRTMLLR
jgi:hypothetical protein